MQDIFIRIIFGFLIISVISTLYEVSKRALSELHSAMALPILLIAITFLYLVGGLLIK